MAPVRKKGDKTEGSNYQGISLLSISYKTLSNIILSGLTPYTDDVIWVINVNFDVIDQ